MEFITFYTTPGLRDALEKSGLKDLAKLSSHDIKTDEYGSLASEARLQHAKETDDQIRDRAAFRALSRSRQTPARFGVDSGRRRPIVESRETGTRPGLEYTNDVQYIGRVLGYSQAELTSIHSVLKNIRTGVSIILLLKAAEVLYALFN